MRVSSLTFTRGVPIRKPARPAVALCAQWSRKVRPRCRCFPPPLQSLNSADFAARFALLACTKSQTHASSKPRLRGYRSAVEVQCRHCTCAPSVSFPPLPSRHHLERIVYVSPLFSDTRYTGRYTAAEPRGARALERAGNSPLSDPDGRETARARVPRYILKQPCKICSRSLRSGSEAVKTTMNSTVCRDN